MRVGVQLRPWLIQKPSPPLGQVLDEVCAAGYTGIEIGAHYLDWDHPQNLRCELEIRRLEMCGVHVGGDIFDKPNVLRVRAEIEHVVGAAAALGAQNLLFSGLLLENKSQSEQQVELTQVQKAAAVCARQGLRLCYHNHWWEIAKDYADLRFLAHHTDPQQVSFCLDLGWVQRAGGNPLEVVKLFGKRARSFHLRDDSPEKLWKPLGEGMIDLLPLLRQAAEYQPDWMVVEQDDIQGSVKDPLAQNRRFLLDHLGW